MEHRTNPEGRTTSGMRRTLRRWTLRTGPIAVVLLFLLSSSAAAATLGPASLSTVPAAVSSQPGPANSPIAFPGPSSAASTPHVPVPSHLPHSAPAAPAAPRPAANNTTYVENGSAAFFTNTNVSQPASPTCKTYYLSYYDCWNITTEPALNLTTDGYTGLAYTAFTNQTPCVSMNGNASTQVGFVVSTDFGTTWSAPAYLGNPVCTGVEDRNYSSAYEPSLTSLSNGTFVLSYIEYNTTAGGYYYYSAPPNMLGYCYQAMDFDRVVVTESYDHGASWSTPTVIESHAFNYSNTSCPATGFPDVRPQITATGNTIYLTWFDASNPYQYYYGYTYQASVHFILSTDGGTTWGASQLLTTESNAANYPSTSLATSPTVLVDPSGQVYVAYTSNFTQTYTCTNVTCFYANTANVVVATSTDNGTTFSYVDAAQGVISPYSNFYPYTYVDPQPALAYNPVFGQVYLTYTAGLYGTWCDYYGYSTYCNPQVLGTIWFQNSSTSGATWSAPVPVSPPATDANGIAYASPSYNPSMAVDANGRIHLQFARMDDSQCFSVGTIYSSYYCAPIEELYTNSSDNGLTWINPVVVDSNLTPGYGTYRETWDGTFSSTLAAGTQVLLGWTHVQCPSWSTPPYGGSCYQPQYNTASGVFAQVEMSRLFQGTGIVVSFTETGLPSGTIWSVNIGGNLRFGPAGDTFSISGVPPGASISWTSPWINTSYGIAFYPTYSVSPPSSFSVSSTVSLTYTELVLFNVLSVPSIQSYYFTAAQVNFGMNPLPGAFWITAGTPQTLTVTPQAWATFCYPCLNLSWQSWTGLGAGSVSSTSMSISLTPTGPVNETANFAVNGVCWIGYYAGCLNYTYDLSFQEVGLPSGSQWGVTVFNPDGSSVTNLSTNSLVGFNITSGLTSFDAWTVPDPNTGEFWVPTTTVSSPLMVPQASSILVTYVLRTIATSAFATTFQETGLWEGTSWALDLGGTSYGMTSVNATWSLAGGSAVSVNGSYVYLPNGTAFYASSVDVTPFVINESAYSVGAGGLVTLNGSAIVTIVYKPMYWLSVTASVGGTVTPDAQWVKLGASAVLGETAWPGYYFIGWTGTGTGSISTGINGPTVSPRGPVTEFATFRPIPPPTWNVTVSAVGLPSGTPFSVSIGASTYTGVAGFKVGNISSGGYAVAAPTVYLNSTETTRFTVTDLTSTLGLAGGVLNISGDGSVTVTYGTQYALSVAATPGGTVSGGNGTVWANATDLLTLTAVPDPSYRFVGWNGTGLGSVTSTSTSISLTPQGPATETAQFAFRPTPPPAVYWLSVSESGLPTGTAWSVAVGSIGASGINGTLTVVGLNGSYALTAPPVYSASPGTRWVSDATNVSTTVVQNGTFTVAFTEQFLVTVLAGEGGSVTPSTDWVDSGASVTIVATANASSQFLVWNGTGTNSYNGTTASQTITVTGPLTEQASFGPLATGGSGGGGSSTSASNGQLMSILLLVALLVVGAIVGLLLGRGRRPSSPPPMQEYEVEPTTEGAPTETEAPATAIYDEGPGQSG